MIFIVAWKNVWRNKVRSIVVMMSVAVGLLCGIFFMAFMNGMAKQRVDSAIRSEVSHIQIHSSEYLEDEEVNYTIPDIVSVERKINDCEYVEAASSRVIISGMARSARASKGVRIVGIDRASEERVTNIYTKITDSLPGYFNKKYPVLMSERLAKELNIRLKQKVQFVFQSVDGSLTSESFKVTALYKTSNKVFDDMMVFVPRNKISGFAGLEKNQVHEIAILLKDNEMLISAAQELNMNSPEITTRTWKKIMPELGMMIDMMDNMLVIFMSIILVALAFGIINTMLMVVLERSREIGMLMAIGMNGKRIFGMILLETLFLSLTGGIIGITAATIVVNISSHSGMDLSAYSKGLEAIGYDSMVFPVMDTSYYPILIIMVVVTALLSSIYPAIKALKLNPATAMRIDA